MPRAMQKAEIASFARLLVTDTAQNLMRVFFLREKLKGLADGGWDGKRVHVIGAGAMGGDIAAWCAWQGFTVSLADMKPEPLAGAIKRAAELFGKIGRTSARDIRDALDRLIPDLSGEGVAHRRSRHRGGAGKARAQAEGLCRHRAADEARRHPGHQHVEHPARAIARPACRGRSGSSACISSIRSRACNWSRWSATIGSRPTCSPTARAFLGRIDRLPAPVKSAPGFLVNRALTPYLLEAHGDARRGHVKRRPSTRRPKTSACRWGRSSCRRGRPRHLPARRRDAARAASTAPMPDAAAMAAATRSPRASSAGRPARACTTGRTARR